MSSPAAPPYDEQATLEELVFALGRRDEPTVALVECASLAKRRELEAQLAGRMPEYRFYTFDVTPYAVTSLLATLNEHLPEEVKAAPPVTWVVHVHGLENSQLLSQDGQLVPLPMTAQLNLERELLFRSVPYLIVLWGDADFFRTLQREAPDFCHWVTYRFRFEDHTARPVAELPPLPPERLPGSGNVPKRQARIAELKERYDRLALDDSDKKRLLRDKIDILSLLGAEYKEAFMYDEAEEAYKSAIALQERLREPEATQGSMWYELGNTYLKKNQYYQALEAFAESKKRLSEANWPALHHQAGRVYAAQREWELALEAYKQALESWQNLSDGFNQCHAYFNIGRVYEQQLQWEQALDNYSKAIAVGIVSQNWSKVGQAYFQIGRIYEQQENFKFSIESYNTALRLQEQHDDFDAGGTCYHLGRVYEAQNMFKEAFAWYGTAVEHLSKYGHPFLARAQASLANAIDKL